MFSNCVVTVPPRLPSSSLHLPLALPGDLLRHQPSCRHLPGGPRGEGAAERHHPLCRALHQDVGRQQGGPSLPFVSLTYASSLSPPLSSQIDCIFSVLPFLRRLLRRCSKLPSRRASAWASTGCHSPGLPSKTGINITQEYICLDSSVWIHLLEFSFIEKKILKCNCFTSLFFEIVEPILRFMQFRLSQPCGPLMQHICQCNIKNIKAALKTLKPVTVALLVFPGRCSKMLRAAWTWTGSFLRCTDTTAAKSPPMTSSSCWPTSGSESSPLSCYFSPCICTFCTWCISCVECVFSSSDPRRANSRRSLDS